MSNPVSSLNFKAESFFPKNYAKEKKVLSTDQYAKLASDLLDLRKNQSKDSPSGSEVSSGTVVSSYDSKAATPTAEKKEKKVLPTEQYAKLASDRLDLQKNQSKDSPSSSEVSSYDSNAATPTAEKKGWGCAIC